jgi:murein DD-endopeptidase MepM/ murein hydrolase activator NlpD
MAKLQDAGEDAPKHRPLPSVEMALLPHELRAVRVRQALAAVLGLVVVGGGLALTVARPWLGALLHESPPASEEPWPSERAVAAATAAPVCDPKASPANVTPTDPPMAMAAAKPPPSQPEPAKAQEAPALDEPPGEPIPEEQPVAVLSPTDASIEGRSVRRLGQARGFQDSLVKAGLLPADARGVVSAFTKLVDFRRAQPEDELVIDRTPAGGLLALEYRASPTERYRAEHKSDGTFKAAKVKVTIEHRRVAKGGYLSDSLGKALEALGLRSNIAGVFVEAFEGKIDFKKQARQGDSFRVVIDQDYVDGQQLGSAHVHALEYRGAKSGELRAYWFETEPGDGDFYDETGRAMHGGWLRTPLRYDYISSRFNLRRKHPILKRIMPHEGIDYSAAPGTTVWAAAEGTVTFVGRRGPNGNLVALQHSGGYETFYAHLLRVAHGLAHGTHVKQRQAIGAVGSTGRSTGPHLHFALKRQGHFIDPATQLNGPGKPLPEALLPKFKHSAAQLKRDLGAIPLAAAPAPIGGETEPSEDFHEDAVDL